ncbi:UNVERIFIED_CONTAM: hypothetical protein FKN15_030243 [Acipenser sinensis]
MLGTRAPALLVSALWRLVLSASALGDSVLDARCFSVWCSTLGALPSTHAPSVLGARCSTLDARRFDAELGTVTQRLVKLAQLNAQAQGRSIVALVVAGRQLWLSQARVQEPDKAPLLDAPITPGHTFGWAVEDMLQRSAKAHEASQRMARMWPNKPFQLKRPQEHQWRRTLPQQQAHPRDMYDQVLKFGAYIVDGLREYRQPVLVYIPPQAELRGGSWVVIDPTINPRHMEMYADRDSRGGVLEPEGTVEIKFRKKDLVKTMRRVDPVYSKLAERLGELLKSSFQGCLGCARSRGAWPEPRGRGLPPPLGRHPPRCGLTNAGWPRADTPEGAVILPRDCACCCGGALRHWRSCGRLGWNGLLGHIFANCCDASRALTERCSISSTAGPNVCPGEIGASSNGTLSGSCTLACESQSCLLATTREAMLLPCARAFNWANLTSNCATVPSSVLRAADGHSGRSRKSAAW